jgi:hypothetical protein
MILLFTLHFFLTSWDWTSPYEICAILVYSLLFSPWSFPPSDSVPNHNMLPWMIGHQVHLNAFPLYQNMVNLIVGFPIWRRSSIFMNIAKWEHCTFDNEIFRCGKIYYSNSIFITNFV